MTREEAILCIKGIKNYGRDTFTEQSDWQESLDMAIKALEQEPCEDAISRQDVLDLAKKGVLISNGNYESVCKVINELSSVTTRSMWISVRERLPEIGQCVLLSLRSLDIEVGFRAETEPYFYCHNADGCYIEPQNILAWQPLPQPYKGDN